MCSSLKYDFVSLTSFMLIGQIADTYLAASIPQRHGVVVGGVCPGAGWVDSAELVHVVVNVGCGCQKKTTEN